MRRSDHMLYLMSYGLTDTIPRPNSGPGNLWCLNVQASLDPQQAKQAQLLPPCGEGSSQERSSPSYARRHPPVATVPCFHPVKAYRSRVLNPETGRYGITFNPTKSLVEGSSLAVPCGRCIGCRIDRSKAWAVRCMHEAQLHPQNAFVTLTYDDKHLPHDFSVAVRPLQLFLKKLRKSLPHKIRFFACGEYGEDDPDPFQGNRPHYHLLIFNHQFSDLKLHSKTNNVPLFTSQKLQNLWPYGFSTTGHVTYQTAAYVARYTIKKIGGDTAADHYTRVHPVSGQMVRVKPEFSTQSRRPGVGSAWFDTFKSDIYPCDFVIVDGKPHPVPKFYHLKLAEEEQTASKRKRVAHANKHRADNTPARLRVREAVLLDSTKQLKRTLK